MKADKSTMATIRRVTIGNMSRGCSGASLEHLSDARWENCGCHGQRKVERQVSEPESRCDSESEICRTGCRSQAARFLPRAKIWLVDAPAKLLP